MSLSFEDIKKIASNLGFDAVMDVRGIHSPVELCQGIAPDNSKSPYSGVYCQFRSNGDLYIGKAINVVKRHNVHMQTHKFTVDYLAFHYIPINQLSNQEHRFIERAQTLGYPLVNQQLVRSEALSMQEFDDLVPVAAQNAFLEKLAQGGPRVTDWALVCQNALGWEIHEWDCFMCDPAKAVVLQIAKAFVNALIPQPGSLVGQFWRVNLSTKGRTAREQSIFNLSAGFRLVLTIYRFAPLRDALLARVLFDPNFLLKRFTSQEAVEEAFPWCQFNWQAQPDDENNDTVDLDPDVVLDDDDASATTASELTTDSQCDSSADQRGPFETTADRAQSLKASLTSSSTGLTTPEENLAIAYLTRADNEIQRGFVSPQDAVTRVLRPIAQVDTSTLCTLVCDARALMDTLADPALGCSVYLALMALMRGKQTINDKHHNSLLSYQLLSA